MGPLPDHRVDLSYVPAVAVDLFGPIEYQGTVNKRQVHKGWGVVFVCTTTSAVHIEFVDTYSTDSFLMALVHEGDTNTIPVGQRRAIGGGS